MKQLNDVLVDGSDYLISLSKLLGIKVVDVHGCVERVQGEYYFNSAFAQLEDGRTIHFDGVHDYVWTYIPGDIDLEPFYYDEDEEE